MRLFLAVWLSPKIKSEVESLIKVLAHDSSGTKWSKAEQLHFTLKFLGEQSSSLPEKMQPFLQELAGKTSVFTLGFGSGGFFPLHGEPRVLWLGLDDGASEMCVLATAIDEICVQIGLPGEERPFKPHLTIGRIKTDSARFNRELICAGISGQMTVDRFSLVESRLTSSGSIYREVASYQLTGGK
jgi:2'-5' RNA ligase